jgi:predicted neutral ceramidase superfamily lipid hydrolase
VKFRLPRSRGSQIYLLLLIGVFVGLLMVVSGPWREGLMVVGITFIVAALARLVVSAEHVGMLRVRSKAFDIFWTTTLGVSLCVLALVVPPGPSG